jgi:hypothetical protein
MDELLLTLDVAFGLFVVWMTIAFGLAAIWYMTVLVLKLKASAGRRL